MNIKNPTLKEMYSAAAKKGRSAYNIAFRDASKAPEVCGIETRGYKGRKGNYILVNAIDDFRVIKVVVSIYTADGTLIEQGDTVQEKNGIYWSYTVTKTNKAYIGCTIKATAIDLPGNEGSLEVKVERMRKQRK